jgi:predicted lactoylglutathione lyase
MARMLFPNLAVKDLDRSVAFFSGLGFTFDERFTDDTATAMVVNELATVMLLTESKFSEFTTRELADPTKQTETIIAVSAETREDVDTFVEKALGSGGSRAKEPMDMGFMYGRSFHDPDGHHWEVVWMDPAALEQSPSASAEATLA